MTKEAIAKFQVIGALVKMQTISLDEEIELLEGIPYDIDFDQDFSAIYLGDQPILDMPVAYVIEFLDKGIQIFDDSAPMLPTGEEYRRRREFWKVIDKNVKKDIKRREKREKKWERGKEERKEYMNRITKWEKDLEELMKKGW